MTYKKGLIGMWGVQVKQARSGTVCKMSSVWVERFITKSPSSVKCKCPQRVAMRPSRKSQAISGTRTPSK